MSKKRVKKLSDEEIAEIVDYKANRKLRNDNPLSDIRVEVKPKTENQRKLMNSIRDNDVTLAIGPAGSGKTFISCSEALKYLKAIGSTYKKIVIIKSVTPLKGEEIGWLKGTMEEKMLPYTYSFFYNFEKVIGKVLLNKLVEANLIEILPIAYMRGINIDDALIIVDEVQNISKDNVKTILTRLGNNSKLILLGDESQIDMTNKKNSSLSFIREKFMNSNVKGIDTVLFDKNDILRHRLTKFFIDMFEEEDSSNK